MEKLAIIGANEFQKKIVLKAKEMNIETHVFAWEAGAVAKEVADYFYPINILDKNNILETLKNIQVNGICSIASDLAMPTVNYIAEELKLVGNSHECTILTTNKYEMRERLKLKDLPIPEYQLIKQKEDINYDLINFPLIIKPIDRSGSRGVYKATNSKELKDVIEKAKKVSFTDEILIEEFIDGNEYSVEAISQRGVHNIIQVTEKFTSGTPNFIESAHLSPARIDNHLKERIFEIIKKALIALKVENGASHSEIKISSKGDIKIIEIAARMGGDFIGSDMVEISTGFDFVKSVIKVSMGKHLNFNYHVNNKTALVKFIFDKEDIKKLDEIKNKFPTIVKEDYINPQMNKVTDSSTRNGYGILEMNNKEQLRQVLTIFDMDKSKIVLGGAIHD